MVTFIDYDPAGLNPAVTAPVRSRRFRFSLPKIFRRRKFWAVFIAAALVIILPAYLFIVRPGQELYVSFQDAKASAAKVQSAIGAQDVITADKEISDLDIKVERIRQKIDYFGFTDRLPWVGDYYRDFRHLILASQYGIEGGKIITTELLPFADVLGLNGKATGTAEEKLQKVVEVMPKIAPRTDDVAIKLEASNKELSTVDPNRYPVKLGELAPREMLKSAKDTVQLIADFMPQAKDVLTYAPVGLGSPTPKNYMVVFQNDKELRPSGGFLTAYTFATLTRGKVSTAGTEDLYTLDQTVPNKPRAPAAILKYLPMVPVWNLRDANLSPDFRTSMDTFESMYRKSSQYRANNGYIGMDTYFLQSLLRLTGPVKTASTGDTFSADNVVEKLETYAELVFRNAPNRKGFLGELMKEILNRITKAKSDQWAGIIQTMITSFNEKHVLLYSKDAEVQKLIEHYDWGGRIEDYSGDYLHINDTNFAGAKANLYIKEKIVQDITIDKDGTVTKKVTVEETNTGKYDGWLNGTYRDWIRMYVPKASQFITNMGGEVKTSTTADELGKTMFESFITVRPLGIGGSNKTTWSVTYQLPFKVTGKELKIFQQKQPGVEGPDVIISVNGKVKVSEQLRTDKEFTIALD